MLLALIPVVSMLPACSRWRIVTVLMIAMIVYESVRFAEFREQVRHDPPAEH